jgi:hypothetical protein
MTVNVAGVIQDGGRVVPSLPEISNRDGQGILMLVVNVVKTGDSTSVVKTVEVMSLVQQGEIVVKTIEIVEDVPQVLKDGKMSERSEAS